MFRVEVPEVLMDLFKIRHVVSGIFKIYWQESGRDGKQFLPNLWWDVSDVFLFKLPTLEVFYAALIDRSVEARVRW